MVSKKRLDQLRQILKEDHNLVLSDKDLSKLGNSLVGYFLLLAKINHRTKMQVDTGGQK